MSEIAKEWTARIFIEEQDGRTTHARVHVRTRDTELIDGHHAADLVRDRVEGAAVEQRRKPLQHAAQSLHAPHFITICRRSFAARNHRRRARVKVPACTRSCRSSTRTSRDALAGRPRLW